jgi:hypothetical protein
VSHSASTGGARESKENYSAAPYLIQKMHEDISAEHNCERGANRSAKTIFELLVPMTLTERN